MCNKYVLKSLVWQVMNNYIILFKGVLKIYKRILRIPALLEMCEYGEALEMKDRMLVCCSKNKMFHDSPSSSGDHDYTLGIILYECLG